MSANYNPKSQGILKKIKTKLLSSSKDCKNRRETENNPQAK